MYRNYLKDFLNYSSQYPWGIFHRKVVRGYFPNKEKGVTQKVFFKALLKRGFRRTQWQLVLPGQTAGLVKRVPPNEQGANQYHVRFYDDGTIDCEIEYHRFHLLHWSGPRSKEKTLLDKILRELSEIPPGIEQELQELFCEKPCDFKIE